MRRLPPVAITRTNRQRILYRPAVRQSPAQAAIRDSRYSRPFGQRVGFAVAHKNPVCVRVVGLFHRRCPSAIARLVVAIRINAIQRVLSPRTRPHVCIEVFKRLAPAGTDLNPPAAVKVILGVVGIAAPLTHGAPRTSLWRLTHAVRPTRFTATASTTSRRGVLAEEPRSNDGCCLPASAATQPERIVPGVLAYVSQHIQAAEREAGQVLSNCLRNWYSFCSHVRTSSTNVMRGLRGVRSALQSPLFYHNRVYGQLGQGPRIRP